MKEQRYIRFALLWHQSGSSVPKRIQRTGTSLQRRGSPEGLLSDEFLLAEACGLLGRLLGKGVHGIDISGRVHPNATQMPLPLGISFGWSSDWLW